MLNFTVQVYGLVIRNPRRVIAACCARLTSLGQSHKDLGRNGAGSSDLLLLYLNINS